MSKESLDALFFTYGYLAAGKYGKAEYLNQ